MIILGSSDFPITPLLHGEGSTQLINVVYGVSRREGTSPILKVLHI